LPDTPPGSNKEWKDELRRRELSLSDHPSQRIGTSKPARPVRGVRRHAAKILPCHP